jgi:hypothetical protein
MHASREQLLRSNQPKELLGEVIRKQSPGAVNGSTDQTTPLVPILRPTTGPMESQYREPIPSAVLPGKDYFLPYYCSKIWAVSNPWCLRPSIFFDNLKLRGVFLERHDVMC